MVPGPPLVMMYMQENAFIPPVMVRMKHSLYVSTKSGMVI